MAPQFLTDGFVQRALVELTHGRSLIVVEHVIGALGHPSLRKRRYNLLPPLFDHVIRVEHLIPVCVKDLTLSCFYDWLVIAISIKAIILLQNFICIRYS